jgi:hypothetical protein
MPHMPRTYEVYVNGSPKFEGAWTECKNFAARVLKYDPDAEVQITEIDG